MQNIAHYQESEVVIMAKYDKYVIQNPIDYGQMRYSSEKINEANVWYMGDVDFGGASFSLVLVRVDHDINMEEHAHTHDFDMYVWHVPLVPDNMEDLGCEVEMVYGAGTEDDPAEKYSITKTGCFYVPAGTVHGPYSFKNVTRPLLFIHALQKGDYYKSETF